MSATPLYSVSHNCTDDWCSFPSGVARRLQDGSGTVVFSHLDHAVTFGAEIMGDTLKFLLDNGDTIHDAARNLDELPVLIVEALTGKVAGRIDMAGRFVPAETPRIPHAVIVNAVRAIDTAMSHLAEHWSSGDLTAEQDNALTANYPFGRSFDEVYADMGPWLATVREALQVPR